MTKRSNIILLLIVILLAPLFAGCGPSKEEEILMGKWEGSYVETDEEGDDMTYRIAMTFKKDLMKLTMTLGEVGVGDFGIITISGDWSADEDEITFFADEDSVDMKYTPQTKAAAAALGMSLDVFEEAVIAMMKQEMGLWEDFKIYSLSRRTLTIDLEGTKVTLHKK